MNNTFRQTLLATAVAIAALGLAAAPALTQTPAEAAQAVSEQQSPEPLSAEELETLVARIALYPDELVAVVSAASLYPLQIVEAQRFLDDQAKNKDLKPKESWDGSVISLLNYPQIVKMMSDDLEWTQIFGEAIVNQQDDVLAAIQQLRSEAVANNVIKSDEKVTVTTVSDNIVIQPASSEVIYVPQYEPQMFYEEGYSYAPVEYYPDPYPYYYDPGAAFFAGAVTGIFWGAMVDWNDGVWGGDWDWNDGWGGGDLDIDCNKCIIGGDFNGKLNIRDADWRNIDRSKINFDRNQFNKMDKSKFKNSFKNNNRNKITNKAASIKGNRPTTLPGKGTKPVKDIRASTLEGLKKQPGAKPGKVNAKPGQRPGDKAGPKPGAKAGQGAAKNRPSGGKIDRPVGKKKPAAKVDNRPKKPSPMGDVRRGADDKKSSNRGAHSMGGGYKQPSGGQSFKKRPMPRGGGGGGGGRGRGRR